MEPGIINALGQFSTQRRTFRGSWLHSQEQQKSHWRFTPTGRSWKPLSRSCSLERWEQWNLGMDNRKTLAKYQVKDPGSGKSPQPNKHSIVSRQPQDKTGEVSESMPEVCSDHSSCLKHYASFLVSELAPFAPERINIGISSLRAYRLKFQCF